MMDYMIDWICADFINKGVLKMYQWENKPQSIAVHNPMTVCFGYFDGFWIIYTGKKKKKR